MVGYTTIYTMLPVFSLILDEDVTEDLVLQFPELYSELQKGRALSIKVASCTLSLQSRVNAAHMTTWVTLPLCFAVWQLTIQHTANTICWSLFAYHKGIEAAASKHNIYEFASAVL